MCRFDCASGGWQLVMGASWRGCRIVGRYRRLVVLVDFLIV